MSDSVEDRVVNMKFNNSTFNTGINSSISVLGRLKQALNFSQTSSSFNKALTTSNSSLDKLKKGMDFSQQNSNIRNLETTASRFSLSKMASAPDLVSKKFIAMATVGITAITNLTNKVIDSGQRMIKSVTVAPIMDGFHEYETLLGSIQTTLANTQSEGTNLQDVNKALAQLNHYSDKTIYNFSQMAKNIGTFTAAGVDLDTSVGAIKGIANVAALSGSTADQASTAMYQLSQAIANNKVGLQDWNSVVNAGMGGKIFQEALFNMAKMQGTLKKVDAGTTFDEWTKAGNSFRNSLQEGWITGDVLTSTLKAFTLEAGDSYSKAQKQALKAKGFSDAQIAALEKQAQTATDAATKVKTFTQLMDTLKEAVGSGWTKSFQIIFGNFNEAKDLWTGVSQSIGNLIQNSAKARNKILGDWKAMGGRTVLIDAIYKLFKNLGAVLKPIKDAFHDVFPSKTGRDLYNITVTFANFVNKLKIGADTSDAIKRTFEGFFSALDIGKQIVSGFFSALLDLFHDVSGGSSSFLDLTANIGDYITSLDNALKQGGQIKTFFHNLAGVFEGPLTALSDLKDLVVDFFATLSNGGSGNVTDAFDAINLDLGKLHTTGENIENFFSKLWDHLSKGLDPIKHAFSTLGEGLLNGIKQGNFDSVLHIINTGLFAGLFLIVKKFTDQITSTTTSVSGLVGAIKGTFGEVTNVLKTMQQEIKSQIILNIAKAVAVLIASVVALSLLDPKRMNTALKGLAAGFAELIGAVAILGHLNGKFGAVKVPAIATGLIALAGAVTILSTAVIALSFIKPEKLTAGITAIGAMFAILVGGAIGLRKASIFLPIVATGLIGVATALNLMLIPVLAMSVLKWESIAKGLSGLAGMLVAVGVGVKALPKLSLITIGIGLNEIAVALNVMTLAIFALSRMSWGSLVKGLIGVAGALTAIAVGMKLMPKGILLQAAALDAISGALVILSGALTVISKLSVGDLAKSLGAIGASLVILGTGIKAMRGSLLGAVALGIAAASLYGLALALQILGSLSIEELAFGLVGLAGAFTVIGLAGKLLQGAVPGLIGFGIALGAIGLGAAAVGFAAVEIANAISTLAKTGTKGIEVVIEGLKKLFTVIPDLATALANAVIAFLLALAKHGPAIVKGLAALLEDLMQAIIKELPTFLELFTKLVHTLIQAIDDNAADIVDALLRLILMMLEKVAHAMPKVVKAGADIIVNFLKGLGKNIGRIVDQAFVLVVKFLNGVADAIDKHLPEIIKAGGKIGVALVTGFWKGLGGLAGYIWDKVKGFFSGLWDKILGFFGISSPSTKAAEMGKNIILGLWNGISGIAQWLWDKITGFLGKLWNFFSNIPGAILGFGKKIVEKIWDGISGAAGWLKDKITGFLSTIGGWLSSGFEDIGNAATDLVSGLTGGHVHVGGTGHTVGSAPSSTDFGNGAGGVPDTGIPSGAHSGGMGRGTSRFIPSDLLNHAQIVSADTTAAALAAGLANREVRPIEFNQYNTSPKALSEIELYRQTNNQLSLAQEVLTDAV